MRVAYVFAGYGQVFAGSGGSVHMQEVIRALCRQSAEVEIFANRLGGEPLPGLEGVARRRLDRSGRGGRSKRMADSMANKRVRDALAARGPFQLVYERFSLGSHAAMEYARDTGVPGVLEINGPRIEKAAERGALTDRGAAEEAAGRAVAAASAVFAVSNGVARYVRETFGSDRVQVVPNGVDPARFPPTLLLRRSAAHRPFTIGFVGTFKPHHGLDTLVEAFALLRRSHPDARLLLVGDGRQRAAVEARLGELGLAGVALFTGEVQAGDIPDRLAEMDVGVAPFPSERAYVSPLKVFEYMAAGLPVVASGAEQVADLIRPGETGFVCPPGDPAALAGALGRLAADPDLRSTLGRAGRADVLARHTWDAVAERILEVAVG